MSISNNSKITASDINGIITKVNNTYRRYTGISNISGVSANSKVLRSLTTSMINDLNVCVNNTRNRRKVYYRGTTLSSLSSQLKASEINNIGNIATQLYNDYCSCNSNCSCDCDNCSCDCDDCSCDCDNCSCDCDDCCDNCDCCDDCCDYDVCDNCADINDCGCDDE